MSSRRAQLLSEQIRTGCRLSSAQIPQSLRLTTSAALDAYIDSIPLLIPPPAKAPTTTLTGKTYTTVPGTGSPGITTRERQLLNEP